MEKIMSKTVEMLKNYVPYNEQEKEDVKMIIEAENIFGDILTRNNKFCHLTASALDNIPSVIAFSIPILSITSSTSINPKPTAPS